MEALVREIKEGAREWRTGKKGRGKRDEEQLRQIEVNRQRQQGTCADWLTSRLDILSSNERRL